MERYAENASNSCHTSWTQGAAQQTTGFGVPERPSRRLRHRLPLPPPPPLLRLRPSPRGPPPSHCPAQCAGCPSSEAAHAFTQSAQASRLPGSHPPPHRALTPITSATTRKAWGAPLRRSGGGLGRRRVRCLFPLLLLLPRRGGLSVRWVLLHRWRPGLSTTALSPAQ